MDGSLSEKLNGILNNPEGMEKIVALAKTLGENDSSKNEETPPEANFLKDLLSSPLMRSFNEGERDRICLLKALRPYVNGERRKKLDTVISAMEGLEALSSMGKIL